MSQSGRTDGRRLDRGPAYAAIDLGTTNCRLLIARPGPEGLQVVDSFSRIVRLGEGVELNRRLSEPAMHRAVSALRICAGKLRRAEIRGLRAVSTAACRKAENGANFLKRVEAETGLDIETITPEEEGRLALTGCQFLIEPDTERVLFFDIGGGSTQIVWMSVAPGAPVERLGMISVPMGVVSLSERLGTDAIDPDAFDALVLEIEGVLAGFCRDLGIAEGLDAYRTQIIGASGTVTTLAALQSDLPRYERALVDGSTLFFESIHRETRRLLALDRAGRRAIGSIGPQRADMIVAGCAILSAICRTWPMECLKVADRGVREGILIDLMRADGVLAPPSA